METEVSLPKIPGIYDCVWKYAHDAELYQYYNFFDGENLCSGDGNLDKYEKKINSAILNGELNYSISGNWTLVSWKLVIPYAG